MELLTARFFYLDSRLSPLAPLIRKTVYSVCLRITASYTSLGSYLTLYRNSKMLHHSYQKRML